MPEDSVPNGGGQHGGWNEKEQDALHKSAKKFATIWGATIRRATTAAQVQNITMLARLRR